VGEIVSIGAPATIEEPPEEVVVSAVAAEPEERILEWYSVL
jgi:hypothetical protein